MSDIELYIDSVAMKQKVMKDDKIIDSVEYVLIVDKTLKNRFFHGYSAYNLSDNYMAYLAGKLWSHLSAIVIPDDLLTYNNAACSQQAILFQEILKNKGFKVRKIGFTSSYSGHFCSEVQYGGKNHFFDTNMEANWDSVEVIPNTKDLVNNDSLLHKVYAYLREEQFILFTQNPPIYGEWDEYPAKKARLFHQLTKFFSNYLFTFIYTHKKKIEP